MNVEQFVRWARLVVRVNCPDGEPFVAAGSAPGLWAAYDELIGPGRWTRRRGVGGDIPVRFPSEEYPGDVGWHIEGSYPVGTEYWANVRSRARGLLALFLFSDVGPDDAPTRLALGSHLAMPRILAPARRGVPRHLRGRPRGQWPQARVMATAEYGRILSYRGP